jgi:cell division protein ZapA
MSAVRFWMFGREFSLACDDGQEPRLHFLVARLKERVEAIAAAAQGNNPHRTIPAQMEMLVMAAITFADEFQDAREALSRLQDVFQPQANSTAQPDSAQIAELRSKHEALEKQLEQMTSRIERLTNGLKAS